MNNSRTRRRSTTYRPHDRRPGWCGPCHTRALCHDVTATCRVWRCSKCETQWIETTNRRPEPQNESLDLFGRAASIAAARQAIAEARARANIPAQDRGGGRAA